MESASPDNSFDYPHSDPQSIKYRLIGAFIILVSCSTAWWLFLDHDLQRFQAIESASVNNIDIERFDIPVEAEQAHVAKREALLAKQPDFLDEPSSQQLAEKAAAESEKMGVGEIVKSDASVDKAKLKPTLNPKAKQNPAEQASKPVAPSKATESNTVKASASKPAINEVALADAWVLQLGSFKDKANAEDLRKKLYKFDIPAYVKKFSVNNTAIYRVLVGPKLNRKAVEKMQSRVRQKAGIQPIIVKFKPGFEQ